MNYVCSTLHTLDALRAVRDELARVAEMEGAASGIVQHPDWLAFEVTSRHDGTTPHIVVVRDGTGRVVGYAPLLAIDHTARLDVAGRRVSLYRGAALRVLGGGVVAADADRATVELVAARQLAGDPAVRVVRIQEADLPNRFARVLSASGGGFRTVSAHLLDQVHWSIGPQASAEAWLAGMDKKKRGDLTQRVGRAYRKLGGDAALHVFERGEDMPRYCALMNALYARTWHHADLPIDWEDPERVALFRRLADAGQLIGHVVLREGRPLAYVHGYRLGDTYLVDDLGYDDEVAKVGIGSVAVFQAVRGLLDRFPGGRVSFGYGDNQYKRLLSTEATPCGSLYVVRPMRATAGFRVYAPVRWLYRGLHRVRDDVRARRQGEGTRRPDGLIHRVMGKARPAAQARAVLTDPERE
ncbi:Acetyltransferase involved in cellulose biosynthesis, CelD/BcsL family [Luteibacter sp. UNC138MFCol5.1]|uniref:GNAT family N-acetyltransferase n=1 Tax=Luteibacter sp. UNC138MFCol5.1 TaxID=1502774 RepID=UPI0008B6E672|nr:GNAT family N-acetyltransferase [Luteibacter sp. UNC138MFCol5.1]SEP14231.1 Acetyltransferase involved in cellulose biosynthesis, CelD/BcsL family [Luteibacter sp. UNC138MFCol5.1]